MSRQALNWALGLAVVILSGLLLIERRKADSPAVDGQAVQLEEAVPDDRRIPPAPREKRSVLLVTCDTTRADHLAPYGADIETPTFVRLAVEGILYEQAVSVAPITLPAHASILTGLYPPQHGVRNNGLHRAAPELLTLAERLKAEGYRTGAFVSAAVLDHQYGLDQGFEIYDDNLSTGRERHPRMVPDRPAEATVASASAWLDQLGPDERFFVWVHFYDPHAAYSPPPPYRDTYRDRLYDGEIAYMDAQLGRLLAHPRLHGLDDVIVSVLADHGESHGEHGERTHAMLVYEATLHIPWLLRIPGGARGLRVRPPVSQVDVVPTLLDLLGLPTDATLPGMSVAPPIPRQDLWSRPLYSETYLPFYTYGWAKLRALREGPLKFIDAPAPELYNLQRDPRELSNVFDQVPGDSHDMQRDLRELLAKFGDVEHETAVTIDAAVQEQLRSLGYQVVGSGAGEEKPGEKRPDPKQFIDLHVDLEVARNLSERRLYKEAVRKLESVLQRDPTNLAALIDLAEAYADDGQIEKGIETTQTALSLDPNLPRLYLLMAGLEGRRGNLEQGLELINVALKRDPQNIEAVIQQAIQLRQLERDEEAEEVLSAALQRDPVNPRLNAIFAQVIELRGGELDAAEARLRKALERDPFLLLAWRVLGDVLERAGRLDDAVAAYREGMKRRPDDVNFHARLGLILARQGSHAEAEAQLREAVRLSPKFRPDLHVSLGACLAETGHWKEAQQEYEKVLEIRPRHPGARNNRAIAYYQTGRLDEAEKEFEALAVQAPNLADPHNNLAAIAIDRKNWKAAESHARRAIALDPGIVEAWNNLGIAFSEQDRYAEAIENFKQALEREASYWPARNNLALTLRKQGHNKEAAEVFSEVLRQVPGQPGVHYELGSLYAGPLKDPEQARLHLNAFLDLVPNDPRAAEVRKQLAQVPAVADGAN